MQRSCDAPVTLVWYPTVSDSNNNTFELEDTVKKKRDWTQVVVVVVLALASLSSVAAAAPSLLVDQCLDGGSVQFAQYQAALLWAERGGDLPAALATNCKVSRPELASSAGWGGESWARFEQYMAAIGEAEQVAAVAPSFEARIEQVRFEQYLAAIEGTEQPAVPAGAWRGGNTVGNGEYAGESWARFEQYLAAIAE